MNPRIRKFPTFNMHSNQLTNKMAANDIHIKLTLCDAQKNFIVNAGNAIKFFYVGVESDVGGD